ncbi:MAG: threonine--tRNA ligase [Clostridiales bacterium]|uniref:threonine--tRNA ligase n=1 Tax=Hornefia butyriciproducens TaxID=2652293 RepID=UPI002A7494CD|nr:threonine--tRNA ligase [Hornefia butyriciproducens]MCI7326968.1 threonine--tRNA ligase [Clostridiales bacterium]MCI7679399.1 threonine--tRNA ligase [Clostridiales bacterium]MDY2990087.1 threonine--tRNA ligase [Hornefia butyriciproducens]MDY5463883.1 threonine--tRNA ligase [Hornefia butyriciproducens]
MKITLKDGSVKEYSHPLSVYEIAQDISEGLARVACVGEVNGEVVDLRTVVDRDSEVSILTFDSDAGKKAYRHTCAHVLAEAVQQVFPEAKLAIGPAIDNGFYYDFDLKPLDRSDLDRIEAAMKKIIKKGDRLEYYTLSREEALKLMEERQEPYKVELINDLPEDATISFYQQGDFIELCAGPHLMSTKQIKAFKLTSTSGAYWRGDEHNKMLTRIYGTAFTKKADLEEYLEYLADIKNRDHNRLGREMELFTTADVIGQGLPLIMPKGAKIIQKLQRWIEDTEDYEWGYVRTKTPLMAKSALYKISDHWYHYKDGMFVFGYEDKEQLNSAAEAERQIHGVEDLSLIENDADSNVYALRPMTCPFQYYVYKATQKSYRDLPYRMGETSTLFRNEDSGEMHGLTRVRQFTISEGHLVCTPEQIDQEFKNCVALAKYCLTTLGLEEDVTYRFSKWNPDNADKYLGTAEEWDKVENAMKVILDEIGLEYTEEKGEAAFYGPKLDIQAKNVYGKEDTMITIQLDMFLAERYDMYYIDKDGSKKRPYIIHRTSIGCYERTLAWLIEKYAGKFPTWLCPEQVRVLPVSEKYEDYAQEVFRELRRNGVDVTVDNSAERLGYKLRQAQMDRLPYMLVVGAKEEEDRTVSVRSRFAGDEGVKPLGEFVNQICEEIRTKEIRKEIRK